MTGWICPKCGRCLSPFTSFCPFCPVYYTTAPSDGGQPITVAPLTVGPVGCTCGSSLLGQSCPIHGSNTCLLTERK